MLNKRYKIVRTIGKGGMGAVYQARDLKHQTLCAIKEMSLSMVPPEERSQAVQNFKAEAKMLANLNHPNLPTFSGFFTEGSRHFLVMEYVEGLTLEEYLERNNAPFSERRVLGWARQLCDVLTYLHSQQPPIIFRDLKPGNIMLMHNGRVKLIDFGIARFFRHASSQDTQLLGTPGFAPPEQYGKAQTDARSDLYSLAVTLFQLMTNTLSEQGFGLSNVHEAYPQISLPVARALEKATALSPGDRFQNIEMFRRALFGEGTFMFENGDQATTPEELAELCAHFPQEAADYIFAGEIEAWLQEIGHADLARTTRQIRTSEADPADALERFLKVIVGPKAHILGNTNKYPAARSRGGGGGGVEGGVEGGGDPRGRPSPPTPSASQPGNSPLTWISSELAYAIDVQPRTIDFGEIYAGSLSAPVMLSIIGNRGAFIQGTFAVTEPWIRLDKTSFAGTSTRVNVQVDTSRLHSSTHYTGTILVIPDEDDEEQDIVVKVEVDVLANASVNGQSRPGLYLGAQFIAPNQEEDDDITIADADIMAMAPPATASPALSTKGVGTGLRAQFIASESDKAKYGEPRETTGSTSSAWDPWQASPVQRLWLQRILTVFAAFMGASLCYTLLSQMPFLAHTSLLQPNPWFIVVLLGMVPAATLGALAVNWSSADTINRFCTGVGTVLLALGTGEFAWQSLIHLPLRPLQLCVMLTIAAISSTIGTHPSVSNQIIEKLLLGMEYVRWLVIIAVIGFGGILGFALTVGFALGWFTFLGIVVGSAAAGALVLRADYLLKQNP